MLPPHLHQALAKTDAQHLMRQRFIIHKNNGVNCCSNDYLNLSQHKKVRQAFIRGIALYGLGSGGSALVSGYTKAHQLLEEAMATFLKRDSALLFNSGYHANLGVLTTLGNRHSVIITDKHVHASLLDATRLSRATHLRYHHHDFEHAKVLLEKNPTSSTLMVSESIFSIQGDLVNIKKLAQLATHHNALLIVDDAHGVGVLGQQGRGIVEHFDLSQQDLPCLITPLGKAMGSMGAVVTGSKELINALLQFARTYRYSTSLPPAICHATLAALTILNKESWRREQLQSLIHFFIKEALKRELPLLSTDTTPIKSIRMANNKKALAIQAYLSAKKIFVSCIRPPTVMAKDTCLRISINCMHSEAQLLFLLDQIKERLDSDERYPSNKEIL